MPNRFSPAELAAIPALLSAPRFQTYLAESGSDTSKALSLYHWNAQISAAFLIPLHVFEVAIRNAVSAAAERAYGANWPWHTSFVTSLPSPAAPNFNPRLALTKTSARHPTTGKVIADMNFAFWVSMFTARHEGRLWTPSLRSEFPMLPTTVSVKMGRAEIHRIADQVRELRNRIAHHEPIFRRDLTADYAAMELVTSYRCSLTAAWLRRSHTVASLLLMRPS